MEQFKIRISHTTHGCLASNINLTKYLYIEPPDIKFILDHSDIYGDISEAGVRKIIEPNVTTIILGARLVKIVDDVIYEVMKKKFIEEVKPTSATFQKTVGTKGGGSVTFNIPPPPTSPPPRLPPNLRLIQHAKKRGDRRAKILCREGNRCWRHKQGICSYLHTTTLETEV